jgi:phosphoglycolate phosphatase-like HAD superfamily hydrolase
MLKREKIKNIIFDFDGVLCESIEYHIKKTNELFGTNLTFDDYQEAHRKNVNESMEEVGNK